MGESSLDPRLAPPPLPPWHISRPRLLAALDGAATVPLTLLAAGPGAGKTVLLTEWAPESGASVAWLTVSAADAGPRRFWPLVLRALHAFRDPGRMPARLTPQRWADRLVPTLLDGLPDGSPAPVLVIDDAHLLTHPDVLHGLDLLIRSGYPPRLRLVLAARSDPLLPLHRYRLAGLMCELRATELAMTDQEAQELLMAHNITLSGEEFGTLLARTEGWAAGLQLSAMRMDESDHPGRFVSELALDEGSVGEYLMAEVIDRQPGPVRQLLEETSLFDEVTGSLAEAVTGLPGCADILAGLSSSNSFVVPLDAARTRFRYHQLFRDILRYQLRQRAPRSVPGLMRRAAAYFEASGEIRDALYWAAQAGDWGYGASLLAHGGLAHAFACREDFSGYGLDVLQALPPPDGAGGPAAQETAVARYAAAAVTIGDAAVAATMLADDPLAGRPSTDPGLLATVGLARLILAMKAGDARAVDAEAARLLDRDPRPGPVPGLRAAIRLAQACTHLWQGQFGDAGALLRAALADAERDASDVLVLDVLATMALADTLDPRPLRAADAAVDAYRMLHRNDGLSAPPALALAAATVLLLAADLDGAAHALRRMVIPPIVGAHPGLAVARVLGQARTLLAQGDAQRARAVLDGASARSGCELLKLQRETLLADIDTVLGQPDAALARLAPYHHGALAVLAAVPRARAHLALNDLAGAQRCVRSALTATGPAASRHVTVEAMLYDARIAGLDGDSGRALARVDAALQVAHGDIILPFVQAEAALRPLLARQPELDGQWPQPRAASPRPAGSGGAPPPQRAPAARRGDPAELPEPLTERERAVLRLLTTSLSAAEIATELCLSINTVKTHIAAVYRKLAVGKRREAVLQARQRELI